MPKAPAIAPMGERALLVRWPGPDAVLAAYTDLRRDPLASQVDLVPGAQSLLVHFDAPVAARQVGQLRRRVAALAHIRRDAPNESGEVALDVVYDGADLDEVGRLTGLGADGVVAAHTGMPWRVAFCGFAPGFGYLADGDARLRVPRRESPRAEVPCGAVGLAGEYSGVYPRPSPGGWQLIGRTDAVLWDLQRDPPALLRPGITVRFRSVRPSVTVSSGNLAAEGAVPAPCGGPSVPAPPSGRIRGLAVVKPGMQCVIQDLGRVGHAAMGVSPSGAADRGSAARANELVGNPAEAAVLEILLGGAEFEARSDVIIAVTGAQVAITVMDAASSASRPRENGCAINLPAGTRLRLGRPRTGLRCYLAARGGFVAERTLGSRSTDTLALLGPAPLRAGQVVPIGSAIEGGGVSAPAPDRSGAAIPHRPDMAAPSDSRDATTLAMFPGPQADWLAGSVADLSDQPWTVSPSSSRVGVRLTGSRLERVRTDELPSQGLVRGAVQWTPSGELVVFLADYPVTGGYPVVAALTDDAVDRAAQLRPGGRVRFVRASP